MITKEFVSLLKQRVSILNSPMGNSERTNSRLKKVSVFFSTNSWISLSNLKGWISTYSTPFSLVFNTYILGFLLMNLRSKMTRLGNDFPQNRGTNRGKTGFRTPKKEISDWKSITYFLLDCCPTWIRTKTYWTKISCTTLILSGNPSDTFVLGCKNKARG